MSIIKIDLPDRNWEDYATQGIEGIIVNKQGSFSIAVEVGELPGNYVYYNCTCPFALNDALINCMVIGDIGIGGFNVRILCTYESAGKI